MKYQGTDSEHSLYYD